MAVNISANMLTLFNDDITIHCHVCTLKARVPWHKKAEIEHHNMHCTAKKSIATQ